MNKVDQWKVIAFALYKTGEPCLRKDLPGLPYVSGWLTLSSRARFPAEQCDRRCQEHTSPDSVSIQSKPKKQPYLFDKNFEGLWILTGEGRHYVETELAPELGPSIIDLYGLPHEMKQTSFADTPRRLSTQDTSGGRALPAKDEADLEGVRTTSLLTYKRRHNRMTNRLKELLEPIKVLREGSYPDAMYDVLIEDWDGSGRDLLVEVKSSCDRGAVRLAVGQLLDYRRHLSRREATDLAVLLPSEAPGRIDAFLQDVGVRHLWFSDERLTAVVGLN